MKQAWIMEDGKIMHEGGYQPLIVLSYESESEVKIHDLGEGDSHAFSVPLLLSALKRIESEPPAEEDERISGDGWASITLWTEGAVGVGRVSRFYRIPPDDRRFHDDASYVYKHHCGAAYWITEEARSEIVKLLEEWPT